MITHVAIRFRGKIYSLPAPNRHHHIIRMIVEQTGAETVDGPSNDQGFLDESGTYYNRKQALAHAQYFGQIIDESKVYADILTSENVW
jgi:hypothetical protein